MYKSVADDDVDADDVDNVCGILIKICCGAHRQVMFKFSPTESWSVANMVSNMVVPGNVLSTTSVSYGNYCCCWM